MPIRKKIKRNIVKGVITSIIGVIAMVITLVCIFNGTFGWVWEGIGGMVIGVLLLLAPESIERKTSELIKKFRGDDNSDYVQ